MSRVFSQFLLFFCMCIYAMPLFAQDDKALSKQINQIKRSGEYIYAESTAENEDDAKSSSKQIINIEITKYIAEKSGASADQQRIVKDDFNLDFIVRQRGDKVSVFSYIKKADVDASLGANPQPQTPQVTPDAMVANTTAAPQPQPQLQPTVTPDATAYDKQAPAAVATPQAEQAPAYPDANTSVSKTSTGEFYPGNLGLSDWQINMIKTIAADDTKFKAKRTLNRFKTQYKVKRLGENDTKSPTPNTTYYAVYDNDRLIALLAPSSTDQHYDFLTGNTVNIADYSRYQHIWFTISK